MTASAPAYGPAARSCVSWFPPPFRPLYRALARGEDLRRKAFRLARYVVREPRKTLARCRSSGRGGRWSRSRRRLSPSFNSLAQTQTAQIPLAMTVTIPVELQQYILELAIPPLIQPSLDERVRLCKTFSLVHRAWTPIAQRELREHCGISLDASFIMSKLPSGLSLRRRGVDGLASDSNFECRGLLR